MMTRRGAWIVQESFSVGEKMFLVPPEAEGGSDPFGVDSHLASVVGSLAQRLSLAATSIYQYPHPIHIFKDILAATTFFIDPPSS